MLATILAAVMVGQPAHIQIEHGVEIDPLYVADITDVGPQCSSGPCLLDGVVQPGTEVEVHEGSIDDGRELRISLPEPNPDVDMTYPETDGMLLNETGALPAVGGMKTVCVNLRAAGASLGSTGAPERRIIEGTNIKARTVLSFDDTTDEEATWEFFVPPNMAPAGQATLQLSYLSNADCGGTSTDDVCMIAETGGVADGEIDDSTLTGLVQDIEENCNSPAAGYRNISVGVAFTHGLDKNDEGVLSLYRDGDGLSCTAGDDLTGDFDVISAQLCFEVDNVFSGE